MARRTIHVVDPRSHPYLRGRPSKVFVVGRNKTGTTSIEVALRAMGYRVGDQATAELLYHNHYFDGDFAPILSYCRSADAFQDVPFSARGMAPILDAAFPGSKFILSIRSSPEEWYESLVRFHGRHFGTDGAPPTAEELRAATYRTPGFMANVMRYYGTTEEDPYARDRLILDYESHNREILAHFEYRPEQLLVLNPSDSDALSRLEGFLGRSSGLAKMPHENRTAR